MDCNPAALAIGLTTDAGPGGVAKLSGLCQELAERLSIPVLNASEADHEALRAMGARRVGVVTPFNAETNENVLLNVEEAGFEVVAIDGTEAPSLPAICQTAIEDIRQTFMKVAESDCDAILQVGTALPVVALLDDLERETAKPVVACNAALYWQTLRAIGIDDQIPGFGRLLSSY